MEAAVLETKPPKLSHKIYTATQTVLTTRTFPFKACLICLTILISLKCLIDIPFSPKIRLQRQIPELNEQWLRESCPHQQQVQRYQQSVECNYEHCHLCQTAAKYDKSLNFVFI